MEIYADAVKIEKARPHPRYADGNAKGWEPELIEKTSDEQTLIHVRRQSNDWRTAAYRIDDLEGLHYSNISGGVGANMGRNFLCAYVWCNAMISGELAHSCRHGDGPHRVKVVVTQKGNEEVYSQLTERLLRSQNARRPN